MLDDYELLLLDIAEHDWRQRRIRGVGSFVPVVPSPGAADRELREDGGLELREDGGIELRDG